MGDDLGDNWWEHGSEQDTPAGREDKKLSQEEKPKKRKSQCDRAAKAKKQKVECFIKEVKDVADTNSEKPKKKRKKKKNISDVLASSEPKPGRPEDLLKLVEEHFSSIRSVIEMEDLKLPDSSFVPSNDLSHSLSSYLKEVCPKWCKVQKNHTEKKSVVLLIICSSALRSIELIKQLTTFKGEAKVVKLFAKHIKVEEQVKLLEKTVIHIGVGTPGRVKALVENEGLSLQALRFVVLDWNWRDQKQRRMVDVPEVRGDMLKLLEMGIIKGCKDGPIKLGLF